MRKSFVVGVAVILAAAAGAAQAPPGDPLMGICSGFLAQPGVAISADANRLCTCLVREVKAGLSRAEMETYDRANAAGQPLPAALQGKITGIAVQCLGEAK
ncbi:MAG: hypothetical protein SFV21_05490 [Rhodospirillaceae bacterium]|nr:hypothetical protein [Rhodospirillaceae bacterium]